MTHATAAEAVGRSRAAVSNLLRLLDLADEVKTLVEHRELEMGHARALLSLENRRQQSEVGALVAKKKLSVRETKGAGKAADDAPAAGDRRERFASGCKHPQARKRSEREARPSTCSIPLPAGVSSSSAITRLMSLTAFSNTSTEPRAAAMHGGSFGVRQASLLNPPRRHPPHPVLRAARPVRSELRRCARRDRRGWTARRSGLDGCVALPTGAAQRRSRATSLVIETKYRCSRPRQVLAAAFVIEQPPAERRIKPRTPRRRATTGDSVSLMIDFDATGRVGYEFSIGLGGGVRDGLITNQDQFDRDWDGEWRHAVSESEEQWTVELFIPWSTISMRGSPGGATRTIGVYASRYLHERDEPTPAPASPPTPQPCRISRAWTLRSSTPRASWTSHRTRRPSATRFAMTPNSKQAPTSCGRPRRISGLRRR